MLVGAVVVHLPDLFGDVRCAAAGDLDVVNLAFGNAGRSAAQAQDDLIGEAVGDLAGGVFRGVFAVLLGEHLRVLKILGVEEKAVGDEFAADHAQRAEGNEGRAGGRVRVALQLHLRGRSGVPGGIRLLETMSKMPALARSA